MKKWSLLILVSLSVGMVSYVPKSPPNILFIAIDDLRPDLGCYGNPIVQSPNLDRLASEGSLFTNHFVQVPTCGASRHALLTGNRPVTKRHLSNNISAEILSQNKEPEIPETFIHQLRRKGYHTTGIGKISHSADGYVYGYTEAKSEVRELPYSWDEVLFDPGKWKTGWNAFFAYANGENRQSMNKQVKPYENGQVDDVGYPDGLSANLAIEKIKELKSSSKPFFLGVGFFKPHLPFNSPSKYWDLYSEKEIDVSPNASIPENVNLKSLHSSGEFNQYALGDEEASLFAPVSDQYARKLRRAYYSGISYIDAQVGKVLDELKRSGLEENTIVVIWGDHGWHLGDHLVWGKHTLFERALKSTLIIKNPKLKNTNKQVESIVESIDIFPTLMDLCGVDYSFETHGSSFAEQMKSNKVSVDEFAYSYYNNGISLRTKQYRLTKYYRMEDPTLELYDHQSDPNETKNIAAENEEIVAMLLPLLEEGNTGLYIK